MLQYSRKCHFLRPLCSYKVEGDEQTAKAELRGFRVVTQINLGGPDASAVPKVLLLQPLLCMASGCCLLGEI